MKKRVGILTSGGDCPGLNATIRGVAKALYARMDDNVEIVGILNGYHGLINGEYREMCEDDFRGILTLGGTILGTKRTPFKLMRVVEDDKIDKVAAMKKTYKDAKLDCLLCLGGNGTLIGASANVVMSDISRKNGHVITFAHFFKVGFPTMLATVAVSAIYLIVRFPPM